MKLAGHPPLGSAPGPHPVSAALTVGLHLSESILFSKVSLLQKALSMFLCTQGDCRGSWRVWGGPHICEKVIL